MHATPDTKSQDVNFQTRTDINRGNAYDQLGEPERAIADYVRALELDPRDAYAHRNKGVARTRLGRLGEAMQEFAAAVELKPDYAEAYGSRAEILRRMAPSSSESERAALYQRALADYNKTISLGLGPREAVAYKGRGFVNYYLAHLDAAIALEKQADQSTPADPFFHWMIGLRLQNVGMNALAEKHFGQAVQLDPKFRSRRN